MTDKVSFAERCWDKFFGWAFAGLFVGGCYAMARYILKADDTTIELFAICVLWGGLAGSINKPDGDA